jgi:flavorubredoxin
MKGIEIKPDVYWVGGIDWDIRNFHGYSTNRGTTYNSYLIIDEKITLVDTVKHYLYDEMLSRIKSIIDPKKIDYIISNHVEMDHSGSLPKVNKLIPKAKIITSTRGEKGLKKHYKEDLPLKIVNSGDRLNIGKRTLSFVHIPMVHWPDSMVTYSPYDKLLLPNDAFGQHIASSKRFDDEIEWGILKEEAAKYYANIVFPFGSQVQKALSAVSELKIDMIGPSHGIIWRSRIPNIIKEYQKWSQNQCENKATIIYDSMWGSTEKLAYAIYEGIREENLIVSMNNLSKTHISDVMTEILDSKIIIIGSPTLNNGMMPSIGGFLTYLKGLNPKNRIGFVFGSYGWSGQAVGEIEKILKEMDWEFPIEGFRVNYIPENENLKNIKEKAKQLAQMVKK